MKPRRPRKTAAVAEFGDFQTPPDLAVQVCQLLRRGGAAPRSLVEPTCGVGGLLAAAVREFGSAETAYGADVNPAYVAVAERELTGIVSRCRVTLKTADFFETDWDRTLASLSEPLLLVGNPPWVTSADLGVLKSNNLPVKSNFKQHAGLDAVTGKANFDISEWMLLRLLEAVGGRRATVAMLCKAAVARRVLRHAWSRSFPVERAAVYRIDAARHFAAAVEAVLLVVETGPGTACRTASIYTDLAAAEPNSTLGFSGGDLIADTAAFERTHHLGGAGRIQWRSGIKHDVSAVMEFRREGGRFINGLGESVDLESDYLYPLLKSSDIAAGGAAGRDRWMLVTQKAVNADTAGIARPAPATWAYLNRHAAAFERRGSSIYRGRPPFSIFGVGDYTFAEWKVAISGFYKKLAFTVVGPREGKPSVVDDTVYFLPAAGRRQAALLAELLNSEVSRDFFSTYLFWDAKRPVTVDLLKRLDPHRVALHLSREAEWAECFGATVAVPGRAGKSRAQDRLFPA